MESQIEDFCVNNNAPSDEVVEEVKNLLFKPLRDLKDIDDEIVSLETRLVKLKAKRNDVQKWISRHQAILSPIRRLPGDVLGEIFEHCLPIYINPTLTGTESPLLLTRVCKLWRDVALSEPRLWSRIHITFLEPYTTLNPSDPTYQTALWKGVDAVKEWLSCSGTRPLSISICFDPCGESAWDPSLPTEGSGEAPRCSPTTLELFTFLAQLSPRFEDVQLDMHMDLYRIFENMLDIPQMTRLISLKIFSFTSMATQSGIGSPIGLLDAQNVRQVTVSIDIPGMLYLASSVSVWTKLTKISCHSSLRQTELTTMLEHTPNLIHLMVILESCYDDPIFYPGHIPLPFLRTLFLTDTSSHRRGNLYECIDAPGLIWVMFTCEWMWPGPNPLSNPIASLLKKTTVLKKLSFNGPPSVLTDILGVAPDSITHLFIGSEGRNIDGSICRTRLLHNPRWHMVGDPRQDHDRLSLSDNLLLLPNLQSLEINNHMILLDEEDLFKSITCRMSPPPGSGISVLKHTAIVFYETQERDLGEEIRRHAERLGVKMINLVLDYGEPPKDPKAAVPPPDFGLMSRQINARWSSHEHTKYDLHVDDI